MYVFVNVVDVADVLLLAEYYASNLQVRQAKIQLVHPGSGYAELAEGIARGQVSLFGVRILVLLIGRADVLNREVAVQDSLMRVRDAVNARDPAIIMLVGTPLPWPLDEEKHSRKLYRTTVMLKGLCDAGSTLQYIRATQDCVTLKGVNRLMVDAVRLTAEASANISKLIVSKIECSKLHQEYQVLARGQ